MTSSPNKGKAYARPSIPFTRFLTSPRQLLILRPSLRLKTALYTLSLAIIVLVILALNAATSDGKSVATNDIVNTIPTHDSPADSEEGKNVAQGKDAHLVDEEIQRSFEEPDFSLLSGKQPSEIGCDIPLEGEDRGVQLFIGIFSSADKRGRRDLYRNTIIPDFPPESVTVKFILGLPQPADKLISSASIERAQLIHRVDEEAEEFGDMVILPIIDNIDLGKTHEYFKWVAKEYAGEGRVKGRPRFVIKADDDTILVMPNLLGAFKQLDCSQNIYWGTSAGRSRHFGDYFRGLAYGMSWPLVSWIGNADLPSAHITKIEDARTGQWLRALDPATDPVRRYDLGWTMGDWNQLDISIATVALHWVKLDEWVGELHTRLLKLWSEAERPYTPENAIPLKQIIEKGKIFPDLAAQEVSRQKDLGWDVHRDLGQGS